MSDMPDFLKSILGLNDNHSACRYIRPSGCTMYVAACGFITPTPGTVCRCGKSVDIVPDNTAVSGGKRE